MQLFEWKEEYSVGVLMVDQQHRHLVSLLNQLHAAMRNGSRAAEVKHILADLVSYTRFHFSSEEKLMSDCGYPDLLEHARKHRAMERRVGCFVADFATNSVTTPPKLLAFLKEWLGRHIMETDKEMGRFCARAAQPAALR
jgi:hemerythrin-like metal-binding protein